MLEPWREDRYREVLRTPEKSQRLTQIWRDAYQDEYPAEADPFGFVTTTDLDLIVSELRMGAGSRLLDVGCGRGGPGLWVARKTGSILTGIDILPEAIEQANSLRRKLGGSQSATFSTGSFTDTGLPPSSQDGIMSVDAFWMVLDKPAALREMARVLARGARMVMTTWVPREMEFQAMLRDAGFRLLRCSETPHWRERQMAVYRGILRHRAELERDAGAEAMAVLVAEARDAAGRLAQAPRMLMVAERLP